MILKFSSLLVVIYGVSGSLTTKPRNTLAVVGQSVTISCKSSFTIPVSWVFVSVFLSLEPSITYANGTVNALYSSRNISLKDSDLVIGSVRISDAGTYTCRETGTMNPDKAAAMLYVVEASQPKCNVNKKTNDVNIRSVLCQVSYNGTDSGTVPRDNYMYPVSQWSGCYPATNQYPTSETSGQYNRTYTTKANLNTSIATSTNTTPACVVIINFLARVSDPYLDNRNPNFTWDHFIHNSTAWLPEDAAIMTTATASPSSDVAVGYDRYGSGGVGLSLWSPSLLYSLLLVSSSWCCIVSSGLVDLI